MEPRSDYYWLPPDPWVSFKYCDFFKLVTKRINRKIIQRYKNFGKAVAMGATAPEIDLKGDDGEHFRLSDRIGEKNVVLVFGAIT